MARNADIDGVRKLFCAALLMPLLLVGFEGPSDSRSPGLDDITASLRKRVEELEKSLAALKTELSRQNPVPAAPIPAAMAPTDPAVAAAYDPAPQDSHTLGPLQLRGYSDFGFGRALFEKQPPAGLAGSANGFTLGDFDLFASAQISERLSMLGEALITSDFTNQFGAEMDRLLLTYSFNKYLRVSAGKYNTAIGFYTNEFHRARYFQTATGRPILFADEDNGGILPVHSIGMTATGAIPSGAAGLHWVAEIANGRSSHDLEAGPIQNFVDENNGKAFNVALYARPNWLSGLDAGVSFYQDRLHPVGLDSMRQRIYSAHAALVRPHTELIAEGVILQHSLESSDFNTFSGYGQASYQMGAIRPYMRYEYQRAPASDPILGRIGRSMGPSVGIRYDFSDFATFKVQYGRLQVPGRSTNDAQAQIAFAF